MGLDQVRAESHRDLLATRALDRVVQSLEFADAYNRSTSDERVILDVILKSKDAFKLRSWIRSRLLTDLEDLPYSELRAMAADEQISKYSRMSKDELIRALEAKYGATSLGKRREVVVGTETPASGSGDSGAPSGDADRQDPG